MRTYYLRKTAVIHNYRLQHQKNIDESLYSGNAEIQKEIIYLPQHRDNFRAEKTDCRERPRFYQQFRVGIIGVNFVHETEPYIHSRTKVL